LKTRLRDPHRPARREIYSYEDQVYSKGDFEPDFISEVEAYITYALKQGQKKFAIELYNRFIKGRTSFYSPERKLEMAVYVGDAATRDECRATLKTNLESMADDYLSIIETLPKEFNRIRQALLDAASKCETFTSQREFDGVMKEYSPRDIYSKTLPFLDLLNRIRSTRKDRELKILGKENAYHNNPPN